MKGVGVLQGRKQERKIRPLSGAHPLTQPHLGIPGAHRPLYQQGASPEKGRTQGRSHSPTQQKGTF